MVWKPFAAKGLVAKRLMEVGMLQDHKYRDFEFIPGTNNQYHEQL